MTGPNLLDRIDDLRRTSKLSALWTFVLLSMLFRDVHELAKQEYIEEILSRAVSDGLLLAAGIALTLPLLMVPLNTLLPRAWSRPANLVAVAVMGVGIATNAPGDLDDTWFAAVELLGLAAITWLAWVWPASRFRSPGAGSNEPRRARSQPSVRTRHIDPTERRTP